MELVKEGEISRARNSLESLGLAPGNQETLDELRNEDLRPTELSSPLPIEALLFDPTSSLRISSQILMKSLKSAGRGSAKDLSGLRYEHLRVLLDDEESWNLFHLFCQAFANGDIPREISNVLSLGRITALKKENG